MAASSRRRGASEDLISGLCDDVLVRILELLPDAGDAVRTCALSRRWRGLWTRAGSLSFNYSSGRLGTGSDKRFIDFVNSALAQRAMADEADLHHLAISFTFTIRYPAVDEQETNLPRLSTEAAQEWIRHATQGTAKSFLLKLQATWRRRYGHRGHVGRLQKPKMDLTDLPSSAKLETMHLELQGLRLKLPATAVFTSLLYLSLENVQLAAGSGHLLTRLLSSACCPLLQKLRLRKLRLHELNDKLLIIEASALLELSISISCYPYPIVGPETLKLKTPNLRILHFKDDADTRTLGISAPELEELTFLPKQPDNIEVDGELPCIGSLKVELSSHGYKDEDNDISDSGICLLRCCTSLTCLEVSLEVRTKKYGFIDIIGGRIPRLLHLLSLTVHAYLPDLHSFGVGIAEILKQCSYLKYLSVHCSTDMHHDVDSSCDHPDHRKSSRQAYSDNIQEVRFTGLVGTDCESSFIQGVLAHAKQLQKVALSFDPEFRLCNMIDCSRFIPCSGGTWVCHGSSLSYEWNSDPIHK